MKKKNSKKIRNRRSRVVSTDLTSFIIKSFKTVNPGTEYLHNWHIDLIAEYLSACERGEIKRLIINMPPRSLKSLCVSVAWPAWLLGQDPARRIIVASYSQRISLKHSADCRLVMSSKWYKRIFPKVKIVSGQNEKAKFVTTKRGFRLATSIDGSVTGEGGNFLIVDDSNNPTHIFSKAKRRHTIEWFEQSFSSRADNKKKSIIAIVMQRLHEEDLSGHLLASGAWTHLNLPALAAKKTLIKFGKFKKTREEGEPLHAAREGAEEIERAQRELGNMAFSAQYQQQPIPKEGGVIKSGWIKRYKTLPDAPTQIVQSWDTAIKASTDSDYSVCTTWYECENAYYLADVFRRRMEYPELKRTAISLAEKYKPHAVLIEDKASGQSLLQDLRRETKLPILPVQPNRDKYTRMTSVSPLFESGRVFLPEFAKWLPDYETEILKFPADANDDQTDSTSQFLNWVRSRNDKKPSIRVL